MGEVVQPGRRGSDHLATSPQSRRGRYAELDAGQLADTVEPAYENDELPDWELVSELSRRAMAAEGSEAHGALAAAPSQA